MSFISEKRSEIDGELYYTGIFVKDFIDKAITEYKAKVEETINNAILPYNPEDTQYTREKAVMVNTHLEQLQKKLQEL